MENHNFSWENPLKMVIFHSCVKLPEGKWSVCLKMQGKPPTSHDESLFSIVLVMKFCYFGATCPAFHGIWLWMGNTYLTLSSYVYIYRDTQFLDNPLWIILSTTHKHQRHIPNLWMPGVFVLLFSQDFSMLCIFLDLEISWDSAGHG